MRSTVGATPAPNRASFCAATRTASGFKSLPENKRPSFSAATPTLPDPMKGSATSSPALRALIHQDLGNSDRFFGRVAAVNAPGRNDIGDAKIVQPSLSLFKEQNELIARAVVIPHPDRPLVPHKRLPEPEPCPLGFRLDHEHRFGIAEQVEMAVAAENAVHLGQQFTKPGVRKDVEPVVAR